MNVRVFEQNCDQVIQSSKTESTSREHKVEHE